MIGYYFKVLTTFSFKGRARRAEYWWFVVFNGMVTFALNLIGIWTDLTLVTPADEALGTPEEHLSILTLIYSLATFVQLLAVNVRRFHDRGNTGWWLALLTVIGIVAGAFNQVALVVVGMASIIYFVLPGTDGPNKYGEDPKAQPAD